MKKLLIPIILLLAVMMSCKKETERLENLGKEAAIEFCNCYKTNSKDDCLDKLTDKYASADYMSDTFIKAFNDQSTCGVELVIINATNNYGLEIIF